MSLVPSSAGENLRWQYLEQYGSEVLCRADEPRPHVFPTVFEAVAAAREQGGCALGRCLHAPMRWVLIKPMPAAGAGGRAGDRS
jgi:hypothetical protein